VKIVIHGQVLDRFGLGTEAYTVQGKWGRPATLPLGLPCRRASVAAATLAAYPRTRTADRGRGRARAKSRPAVGDGHHQQRQSQPARVR
jgi:hypothetical protein